MVIDFNHLSESLTLLFYQQRIETVKDFNDISTELLNKYEDLSWYVNGVTSRNPNFSDLLYIVRCIKLVETCAVREEIDNIITNNYYLAIVLKKRYRVEYTGARRIQMLIFSMIRSLKNLVYIVIWSLKAILCSSNIRKKKWLSREIEIDIDIFCERKELGFTDRYYGNVFNRLPENLRQKMGFVVIYNSMPSTRYIKSVAETAPIPVLYHWDFLKPIDYITSLGKLMKHSTRCFDVEYFGYDLSFVLKHIYRDNIKFYYFLSFIYERFLFRMKDNNVPIKLYVDWYENQAFDRSFYWAMNKYYPEAKVNSYLGFICDPIATPMVIPTNSELKKGLVPTNLFVCNDYYKAMLSNYNGNVQICPLYRSQKIWDIKVVYRDYDDVYILVPLGLNPKEIEFKAYFFKQVLEKGLEQNIKILFKPHPTYGKELLKKIMPSNQQIDIVSGDIYDFLIKAAFVVATNSSTVYEAIGLNIPIIQIVDGSCEYVISKLNNDNIIWEDVLCPTDFIETINRLITVKGDFSKITSREYLFCKETSDNIDSIFC